MKPLRLVPIALACAAAVACGGGISADEAEDLIRDQALASGLSVDEADCVAERALRRFEPDELVMDADDTAEQAVVDGIASITADCTASNTPSPPVTPPRLPVTAPAVTTSPPTMPPPTTSPPSTPPTTAAPPTTAGTTSTTSTTTPTVDDEPTTSRSVEATDVNIFIEVPAEWTDQSTNNADGVRELYVSPDVEQYQTSWGIDGATVTVIEQAIEREGLVEVTAAWNECNLVDELPYDDGLYAGELYHFDQCPGGAGAFVLISTDAIDTHLLGLEAQMVNYDVAVEQLLLSSFYYLIPGG